MLKSFFVPSQISNSTNIPAVRDIIYNNTFPKATQRTFFENNVNWDLAT